VSRCPDCQVEPGETHLDGCDVARCLWTGIQRIQCDGWIGEACQVLADTGRSDLAGALAYHLGLNDWAHRCGDDIWSGEWPGKADARRLGLWVIDRCDRGEGFVRAHRGDPGAIESLNDLHLWLIAWDRETARWEWRTDARPHWWRDTDPEQWRHEGCEL
jgi:hypothetical protein